jgi:hypothetical protein
MSLLGSNGGPATPPDFPSLDDSVGGGAGILDEEDSGPRWASHFDRLRLSHSVDGGTSGTSSPLLSDAACAPADLGPLFIITDADCWLDAAVAAALRELIAHDRSAVRLVVPIAVVRAIASLAGGVGGADPPLIAKAGAALVNFAGASERLRCETSSDAVPSVGTGRHGRGRCQTLLDDALEASAASPRGSPTASPSSRGSRSRARSPHQFGGASSSAGGSTFVDAALVGVRSGEAFDAQGALLDRIRSADDVLARALAYDRAVLASYPATGEAAVVLLSGDKAVRLRAGADGVEAQDARRFVFEDLRSHVSRFYPWGLPPPLLLDVVAVAVDVDAAEGEGGGGGEEAATAAVAAAPAAAAAALLSDVAAQLEREIEAEAVAAKAAAAALAESRRRQQLAAAFAERW